jgi:hypothetical protein
MGDKRESESGGTPSGEKLSPRRVISRGASFDHVDTNGLPIISAGGGSPIQPPPQDPLSTLGLSRVDIAAGVNSNSDSGNNVRLAAPVSKLHRQGSIRLPTLTRDQTSRFSRPGTANSTDSDVSFSKPPKGNFMSWGQSFNNGKVAPDKSNNDNNKNKLNRIEELRPDNDIYDNYNMDIDDGFIVGQSTKNNNTEVAMRLPPPSQYSDALGDAIRFGDLMDMIKRGAWTIFLVLVYSFVLTFFNLFCKCLSHCLVFSGPVRSVCPISYNTF